MSSSTSKPSLKALGIPAGDALSALKQTNGVDSPSDSELAAKNLAALENEMNKKLKVGTDEVEQPGTSTNNSHITGAPVDFSSDPLSATALVSPLHTINWDALAAQGNSINGVANMSTEAAQGSFDSFKRVGPRMPPSLEKLIMDYHHKHSKSWQLAHDMGAGSGVFSPTVARYFRHVHVSDPSSNGVTSSRRVLSAWAAANRRSRGRFTFSTSLPERGHEHMADGTVDMVFVMQGSHMADPTAMMLSAGESLAPNGTLALVNYSPVCRVTGNPRADAAVQRLFAAWGDKPWDVICGDAAGKQRFGLGLDFVPVPDHVFAADRTRRISINPTQENRAFNLPGVTSDASEARVRNSERRQEFSGDHEQAKGWRQEVGPEYFRSLTSALLGAARAQQYEKNFREIADIVHETSPNGILITVEWSVEVLLAMKK